MQLKKQVSTDDLRANLTDILGSVMYNDEKVLVTKYNRPAAVILSLAEYEMLLDPTKRFTKSEWKKRFAFFKDIQTRVPEDQQDSLQEDIDDSIQEARAKSGA